MDENCLLLATRGIYRSCDCRNNDNEINDLFNISQNIIDNIKPYSSIYICTYALDKFVNTILPKIKVPIILVTGYSDDSIPYAHQEAFQKIIESEYVIHWFSQNCLINHPKITRIPIGIYYHTDIESKEVPGIFLTPVEQERDILNLIKTSKPFYERNMRIYGTFHFEIGRADRMEAFKNIPVHLIDYEPTRTGRLESHTKQINYTFVASPYGNGIDCHRTWEALVLGCIPIIKRGSGLDPIFSNLPVLLVDKWDDVTDTLLNNTVNEFKIKFGENILAEELKLKYWIDKINSYKA